MEQTVSSWPRLALIGLEHRAANIVNASEAEHFAKYKRSVEDKVDREMCRHLAKFIPSGPKLKVMVEGASLAVAERVIKSEHEPREVLRLLTEADISASGGRTRRNSSTRPRERESNRLHQLLAHQRQGMFSK